MKMKLQSEYDSYVEGMCFVNYAEDLILIFSRFLDSKNSTRFITLQLQSTLLHISMA